ncbi:hypothetical protein M422DRAFT_37149 [Sphaerobolus stellatus SS14]|uniref:Arrestin-like N-terminal domain-containing protein n=1 Tax=Sphaerobolus stellatus (strain SS14) TaxID=990650 RepID=A0A0C9UUX9_SPHS4|nr:hypothetical protein M422DRAFT_37149 [Sphaerobolus stellatus SS14]
MPRPTLLSFSFPEGPYIPGDKIEGNLIVNVLEARAKELEAIKLYLHGEAKLWFHVTEILQERKGKANSDAETDSEGSTPKPKRVTVLKPQRRRLEQHYTLLDSTKTLWESETPFPKAESDLVSLPFSFALPYKDLPPTYSGGNRDESGAKITYYIRAVGVAGRWYSFNVSAEQYFYVVPVDTSPAPRYAKALSNWMGGWVTYGQRDNVRKSIFSWSSGSVNLKIRLPAVPTYPRLCPLPIVIEITCKSPPLALSCSSQPESFEFPRNPSLENIDIQLYSDLVLRDSAIESETITEKIASGFNISGYGNHHGWCKDVEISRSAPTWAVDPNKPQQGFWSEGINVTGTLLFSDLYVPFHMGSISTSLTLKVQVGFPGLFNTVRMIVEDLPISSGIPPRTMTKTHTTSYNDKDSNSPPMMEQDPNLLLLQAYVDVLNQR